MRIDNGRYREVVMDWSNITPPLKAGTPIAADGTVSNDGDAIGIVPVAVAAQTVMPRSIFILDAGDVDLAEVETLSGLTIAAEAKAAMSAIHFHHADGTVEDYASGNGLPIVTSDDAGKVLAVSDDGAWAPATASGGASGLLVTVTDVEGTATLDKTYAEIVTAINNGVIPLIVATLNENEHYINYVSGAYIDPDNGYVIATMADIMYSSDFEDGALSEVV